MDRKILISRGGANRDRTDDLNNAIVALSQLSYGPTRGLVARKMAQTGPEGKAFLNLGPGYRPKRP